MFEAMTAPNVAAYRAAVRAHLPQERIPEAALGGVLTYIGRADRAIAAKDVNAAHNALLAAQQIVAILRGSLDHTVDPRMSANLEAIYGYVLMELGRANLEKSAKRLQALVPVIAPLHEAWGKAAASVQRPVQAAGGGGRS